jgi:hypothetical protein
MLWTITKKDATTPVWINFNRVMNMLFSPVEQKNGVGIWLFLATQSYIMFKNRSPLSYIRRFGWALGSTANPPQYYLDILRLMVLRSRELHV